MNTKATTVVFAVLFLSLQGCSSLLQTTTDATADSLTLTSAIAPMPTEARQAHLAFAYEAPGTMHSHERTAIHLIVTNLGSVAWPYSGKQDGKYQIRAGNRWIDEKTSTADDGRGSLSYDLRPGEKEEVLIVVTAPEVPGEYTLEFDMVQEQVGWFGETGSQTLRVKIDVE